MFMWSFLFRVLSECWSAQAGCLCEAKIASSQRDEMGRERAVRVRWGQAATTTEPRNDWMANSTQIARRGGNEVKRINILTTTSTQNRFEFQVNSFFFVFSPSLDLICLTYFFLCCLILSSLRDYCLQSIRFAIHLLHNCFGLMDSFSVNLIFKCDTRSELPRQKIKKKFF